MHGFIIKDELFILEELYRTLIQRQRNYDGQLVVGFHQLLALLNLHIEVVHFLLFVLREYFPVREFAVFYLVVQLDVVR